MLDGTLVEQGWSDGVVLTSATESHLVVRCLKECSLGFSRSCRVTSHTGLRGLGP